MIVYLDNILKYSDSPEDHEEHAQAVLWHLQEHCLYAKLEKCGFNLTTLGFWGYRISPAGVEMDPGKVHCILMWQPPRTKKDLRCFLGFANYYHRFIANYSNKMAPLMDCLKEPGPFRWTEATQKAFEELKGWFTSEPILQHADPTHPFVVETDVSDLAIGMVLLQPALKGECLRPCTYFS
ncbi:uncharacterized protein LOC133368041 [Rhineura floridana]|uniref:uncharacterized protein LOC133368041 n=1 Tax=Rhineura floridana TaxID=261503 RepID=UPI002AC85504|nr:uncharacterized protein LOC133368041 [Rhineura floridana]